MSILNRIFGQKSPGDSLDRFDKMLISLSIDGVQTLFVLLAEDGTVNRLGDGFAGCPDHNLYIGPSSEPLFAEFMASVDPAIFSHQGFHDMPVKQGKSCELQVMFGLKGSDKCEGFRFCYGSESVGPPPVIWDWVLKAISLTSGWHAEWKNARSKADAKSK
jgi:hypothetical protein